jgi:hypothetical protein
MEQMFSANGVRQKSPTGDLFTAQEDMMADLFATAFRQATREVEGGKLEISDAGQTIVLSGDAVCMYHEILKNAAESEGIDAEDLKTRFELQKRFMRYIIMKRSGKGTGYFIC